MIIKPSTLDLPIYSENPGFPETTRIYLLMKREEPKNNILKKVGIDFEKKAGLISKV